jgi:hypothetical protein
MSTFNRSNWNKNSGIWSRLFPQQRLSLLGADQLFSVSFESYLRTISPSDGRHSPFYRTITSWGRNTAPLVVCSAKPDPARPISKPTYMESLYSDKDDLTDNRDDLERYLESGRRKPP